MAHKLHGRSLSRTEAIARWKDTSDDGDITKDPPPPFNKTWYSSLCLKRHIVPEKKCTFFCLIIKKCSSSWLFREEAIASSLHWSIDQSRRNGGQQIQHLCPRLFDAFPSFLPSHRPTHPTLLFSFCKLPHRNRYLTFAVLSTHPLYKQPPANFLENDPCSCLHLCKGKLTDYHPFLWAVDTEPNADCLPYLPLS